MIASTIIYQSLRKLGQLRPGYQAPPELMSDALLEWQTWFDDLNAELTMNWSNPTYQFAVTGPGSQTPATVPFSGNGYQIGPSSADGWIAPRPEIITAANCVMTNTGPSPVYIPIRMITQQEWAKLAIQQIPGINVTNLAWYDPQYPNGVFNVFPPLNGNSIQIYTSGVLQAPALLGSDFAAPPGYWNMVCFGLAKRLYYMVTREALPSKVPYQIIATQAKRAEDKLRQVNRPIPRMKNDFPSGPRRAGYYDSFVTYTGEPY